MFKQVSNTGIWVAMLVIGCWATSTVLLMQWQVKWSNPLIFVFILVQMHLYTGLFITAHDAMHGTVSANKGVNNAIGYMCTMFYAVFWYPKLYNNHHKHHRYVHTEGDPDYHNGSFFKWYISFILNYLSIWQLVIMAILFNVLRMWIPQVNLLLFWVVPSLMSTLQLFYFGTYLPHRGEHNNLYHSGTQSRNHLLAFFSCYFFGYHYEHHHSPATPWWRLWKSPPARVNE